MPNLSQLSRMGGAPFRDPNEKYHGTGWGQRNAPGPSTSPMEMGGSYGSPYQAQWIANGPWQGSFGGTGNAPLSTLGNMGTGTAGTGTGTGSSGSDPSTWSSGMWNGTPYSFLGSPQAQQPDNWGGGIGAWSPMQTKANPITGKMPWEMYEPGMPEWAAYGVSPEILAQQRAQNAAWGARYAADQWSNDPQASGYFTDRFNTFKGDNPDAWSQAQEDAYQADRTAMLQGTSDWGSMLRDKAAYMAANGGSATGYAPTSTEAQNAYDSQQKTLDLMRALGYNV